MKKLFISALLVGGLVTSANAEPLGSNQSTIPLKQYCEDLSFVSSVMMRAWQSGSTLDEVFSVIYTSPKEYRDVFTYVAHMVTNEPVAATKVEAETISKEYPKQFFKDCMGPYME